MRRAFTLIELLAVVAVIGAMLTVGLASLSAGKGAARVKGAARDVHAAVRHARSLALVKGQRVLVNYSNETAGDTVMAKVEVVLAEARKSGSRRAVVQPYYVLDYADLPGVRTERTPQTVSASGGALPAVDAEPSSEGESLEEFLFSPVSAEVVSGMRLKVLKGEEELDDETDEQAKARLSVFSTVDYLQNRYKAAKAAEAVRENGPAQEPSAESEEPSSGAADDMNETVSVVWETNGAVEPHKIWIYTDGEKPEDGILLNVDRFGAIKVLDGNGEEDE